MSVRAWLRRRAGRSLARLDRLPGLHRVILGALPRVIERRFDAAAADQLQATLELAIRHPRDGEPRRFELRITGDSCSVRRRPAAAPHARALVGTDDLILLASGAASWPELLAGGRFEISGDPFLALRFASLFGLPVALDPV